MKITRFVRLFKAALESLSRIDFDKAEHWVGGLTGFVGHCALKAAELIGLLSILWEAYGKHLHK